MWPSLSLSQYMLNKLRRRCHANSFSEKPRSCFRIEWCEADRHNYVQSGPTISLIDIVADSRVFLQFVWPECRNYTYRASVQPTCHIEKEVIRTCSTSVSIVNDQYYRLAVGYIE